MKLSKPVAGVCALALVASACGSSTSNSTTGTSSASSGSSSSSSGSSSMSSGTSGQSSSAQGSGSAGGAGADGGTSSPTSGEKVASGGTFTLAVAADPGNLDPQGSASSTVFQTSQFAYDHLLNEDAQGNIVSGLASSWKVTGTKVVLTLHKGITCSDGSMFTAADAAANINYVADPKNKSPFLGTFLPVGAKGTADAAGTVTITLARPAPFVLNGLSSLSLVCGKAVKNRKLLATQTLGTGPYQLTQAASGDQYTYTLRPGYTWGPGGASTATAGMPAKIVVKIVPNETTAANLLLSGSLNAATVVGADAARLDAAHLFSTSANAITGEMWFNQASGRPGADKSVRQALTSALDLAQLAKVLTSGKGTPGTTFAALPPVACPGNSVTAALPAHSLDKAKQLLDAAGWVVGAGGTRSKKGTPLSVTFVYNTATGAAGSAAAELAAATWKQLGADVKTSPQDETASTTTLFSTGNWDIIWEPLNLSTPDGLVPFVSGPVPPAGTNFAHINNSAYTALVTKAANLPGKSGCDLWLKAEAELVKTADVVPFANQAAKFYGKNATFALSGYVVPTSIRMLAS